MMTEAEWERFESRHEPAGMIRARNLYRFRVLLRRLQGKICPICGEHMEGQSVTTIDHVIPKSRGGPDRLGNFLCTHKPCNARKADRMPTGCELVWLLAVNNRLGHGPLTW